MVYYETGNRFSLDTALNLSSLVKINSCVAHLYAAFPFPFIQEASAINSVLFCTPHTIFTCIHPRQNSSLFNYEKVCS